MLTNLIICESPGKIKTIQKYTNNFVVLASYGHILDLSPKKLGVNIKSNFEPTFEIQEDKISVLNNIKKQAKKSDLVFLMTDDDREGHGIAFNIYNQLRQSIDEQKIRRCTMGPARTPFLRLFLQSAWR